MVELFDVANGKMFQMGIFNFGGMLASKTKQTNKQKQTTTTTKKGWGEGEGRCRREQLLTVKAWSYTLSDNCLNNNSLNDIQTTNKQIDKSINILQHTNMMTTTDKVIQSVCC